MKIISKAEQDQVLKSIGLAESGIRVARGALSVSVDALNEVRALLAPRQPEPAHGQEDEAQDLEVAQRFENDSVRVPDGLKTASPGGQDP